MLFTGPFAIMLIAAAAPAIFLMVKVYQLDKLEKEPAGLIIKLIILGFISVIPALILETIGELILGAICYEGSVIYNVIMYFGIVAYAEECSKFFLLKAGSWKSKEFNCQFDGIVYAVAVSLGFALLENIEYVFSYGLGTAFIRAVTAIPGHACFAVVMGLFYGLAKKASNAGDEQKSKLLRRTGIFLAACVHGFYDFVATSPSVLGTVLFIVFILVFFWRCLKLVRRTAATDHYID